MSQQSDNETGASQHSLQKLTRGIAATIAVCGFALIAVIIYLGWSANGRERAAERLRIENALTNSVVRVLEQQKSVAWWDDAVAKISNSLDLEFTDTNFGFFLTETYDQDEIYILDELNRPIYAFSDGVRRDPSSYTVRKLELRGVIAEARGAPEKLITRRVDHFSSKQDGYSFLKGALKSARWSGKITKIGGTPAIVTAITIVPNVDLALLKQTPFLLVSIVRIDDAFMEEVGQSLLIPDLRVGPSEVTVGSSVSESFTTDDGQRAGHLIWTTSRPGYPLLAVILPMILVGVAAMWLLSAKMLHRLTSASSELASREARARFEASHDALSGLPNRLQFIEMSEAALTAPRNGQRNSKVVVGYVDIDRFKDINDTLGHQTGDELIRKVGQRLRERLGQECMVARFGGDEFAIFQTIDRSSDADLVGRRVMDAFVEVLSVNEHSLRVTVSVGLACSPEHGATPSELMRHADIALYVGKRRGRDQAVLFSEEMGRELEENREIEVGLREALQNDKLDLYFQPVIASDLCTVTGVEALLRWFHPTRGAISPATFIPIAEESGLMLELGEWVMRKAIKKAQDWPDLDVAINLSPAQFRHSDLPSSLSKLLNEADMKASHFTLEITEGLLLERSPKIAATLTSLREMGFRIALDDFGTGFSSLKYLIDFRFDKLKIDRSFVQGLSRTNSAQTIVRSVVQLGRTLGMDVIAEGVETNIEATIMRALGCDQMQGYYFSKPIASEDIAGFVQAFSAQSLSAPTEVPARALRLQGI